MTTLRFLFATTRTGISGLFFNTTSTKNLVCSRQAMAGIAMRQFSTVDVSKNLVLITNDKKLPKIKNLQLEEPSEKPLVILLSWLLAKRKHIYKFSNYYTEKGFDVLTVSITPWQLMWPTKGTQVVAAEVVKFLDVNKNYGPLLVHGFSVGGYQWGEVLVHIDNNRACYQHIADRIVGQIWDSAADLSEVWFGFPMAVFPKNMVLQNAMKKYMLYHLKTFDKVATRHYVRSSQVFHSNLIKAPALILLSKSDPVGAEASNLRLKENWENAGVRVYWKCWEKSPHVSHYYYHRDEYLDAWNKFMDTVGLLSYPQKLQAKL